jgi:hypothetical protein
VSEQLSLEDALSDPLAEVERAAFSPGEGPGVCLRSLSAAIQEAKRRNCSQEDIRRAGRRGTALREREALRLAAEASKTYVSRAGGW